MLHVVKYFSTVKYLLPKQD